METQLSGWESGQGGDDVFIVVEGWESGGLGRVACDGGVDSML
jgi:hypothetical protein